MVAKATNLLDKFNHIFLRLLVATDVEVHVLILKKAFITLVIEHFEVLNEVRIHCAIMSGFLNKQVISLLNCKGKVPIGLSSKLLRLRR